LQEVQQVGALLLLLLLLFWVWVGAVLLQVPLCCSSATLVAVAHACSAVGFEHEYHAATAILHRYECTMFMAAGPGLAGGAAGGCSAAISAAVLQFCCPWWQLCMHVQLWGLEHA
jgi:hypothetical protein